MSNDVMIRYVLQLVDEGADEFLAVERANRRSIELTDKALKQEAVTAIKAGDSVRSSAIKQARALETQGRAAQTAARMTDKLYVSHGMRGGAGSDAARLATSYDNVTRSATRAAAAQRTAARAPGPSMISMATQVTTKRGMGAGTGALAGVGLAGAFGVSTLVKQAVDYEAQMSKVKALAGATTAEYKQMDALAKDLGQKTSFSATDSALALTELAKAGFTANQAMKTLPGTMALAASGGVELADAATIQSDAIRGFGLRMSDSGHVADVFATAVNKSAVDMADLGVTLKYMAPIAATTGQSFTDMTASIAVLGNVGIRGDTAGTTLRTTMTNLVKPTKKAKEALGDIGLTAKKLQGPDGLLPLPSIIAKIVDGANKLPKADRLRVLATVFGKESLSGVVALADKGGPAIRKLSNELEHADGSAKAMSQTMQDNVKFSLEQVTGALQTGAINIEQKFAPQIKAAALDISKGIEDFTNDPEAIGTVTTLIGDLGSGISTTAHAAAPLVVAGGSLLHLFASLPDPVKSTAVQVGLLALVMSKLSGSSAVAGVTGMFSGLRKEMALVPGTAKAANAALATTASTAKRAASATRATNAEVAAGRTADGPNGSAILLGQGDAKRTLRQRAGALGNVRGPGRGALAGGLAAGAIGGGLISPGDPLGGAASGALMGSAAGPWGALAGGVAGAMGSAIFGWIDDNAKEAGDRLGKKLAPGLSHSLQKTAADLEKSRQDHEDKAADARERATKPLTSNDDRRPHGRAGATVPRNTADDRREAQREAAAEHAKAVADARKQGLSNAAGLKDKAALGGGRNMDVKTIAKNTMAALDELTVSGKLAGARSMIAWAKGMEEKGQLPKGAAARLAKDIGRKLDISDALAAGGTKGTAALARGLKSPAAINSARSLVKKLGAEYQEIPKTAGNSAENTKHALGEMAEWLQHKLDSTDVTGETRKRMEQDLAAIRAEWSRYREATIADSSAANTAIRNDLGGISQALADSRARLDETKKAWDALAATASGGDFLSDGFGGTPPASPRKKKRGGGRAGYQGGGLVDILASPGEALRYPNGTWGMVPGALVAADNTGMSVPANTEIYTHHGQAILANGGSFSEALANQMPHFATGGRVLAGKAGTYADDPKTGIHDSGDNNIPAMQGASNNQPGVAVYDRSTLGGVWDLRSPFGRRANVRQTDIGPDPGTGRKWDINAVAARVVFHLKQGDGFPTDRGTWTGRYLGKSAKTTNGTGAAKGYSYTKVTDDIKGMSANTARRSMASLRAGAVDGAFGTAFDAARSGERNLRYMGSLLQDIKGAARVNVTRQKVTVPGSSSKSKVGSIGGSGKFNWPTASRSITSGFGGRSSPGGVGSTNHDGIDIGVPVGTSVYAAARGRVNRAGVNGGYGNYVGLTHRGGISSFYGHLSKILTRQGAMVNSGALIGKSGNTGTSTGPHLHFGAHRNGAAIDPRTLLGRKFAKGGKVGGPTRTAAAVGKASGNAVVSKQLVKLFATAPRGKVGDTIDDLATLLDGAENATVHRLQMISGALDKAIRATIAKSSDGGAKVTKSEALVIRRAKATRSLVDAALATRAGSRTQMADDIGHRADQTALMQDRDMRRMNVDPDSSTGLAFAGNHLAGAEVSKRQQRTGLQSALDIAKRRGRAGAEQTKGLQEEIEGLDNDIADIAVQKLENARAALRAKAQEGVDASQFNVDWANAGTQLLGATQRVQGVDQTPDGMRAMAAAQMQAIPGLSDLKTSYEGQALAAFSTGDVSGWRQAMLGATQAATDMANAQADAAETIRAAASKQAQDNIDANQFQVDYVSGQTANWTAQQRVAGTDGTPQGMRDIAGSMLQSVPWLEAVKTSQEAAAATASANGDLPGWKTAMLGAQQAATDLANAQADAVEMIKAAADRASAIASDTADYERSTDDIRYDTFKKQQQIDGTYEGGGAARSAYITNTLVPDADEQIAKDRASYEQKVRDYGADSQQARDANQKLLSDINDRLGLIVESNNEIADNTDTKRIGGTLGFVFNNENVTDTLAGVGA